MDISDLTLKDKVWIDGNQFQYDGQEKVKIGLGKVSQYVFRDYKTGKPKFYNTKIKFKFKKEEGKLIMTTSY